MKQDIAIDLVSRLRSGKYLQGQGALKIMDAEGAVRNCCLGIVCEMAVEAGIIDSPRANASFRGETSYSFGTIDDNSFATLPESVKEWAGFYSDNGSFRESSDAEEEMQERYCLSGFNDTDLDFAQIADVIERYWEDL